MITWVDISLLVRNSMNPQKIAICLCIIALSLPVQAVIAQGERPEVRQDQSLIAAIRKSKVIKVDYPVHAFRSGTEVYVTTLLNPQSTDKSSKIDAVLVAKAVMDADKKVLIVHYRTKIHMTDPDYLAVIVKQSDVMAYGVNAIGVDSLLGQLKVVKRGGKSRSPQNSGNQ
jgi:hypothetical protein